MHLVTKPIILVVDDDSQVLETLAKLLVHFGFDVISHSDSVMALATLEQRNDIAIMVCDYEMPQLNGVELARAAKDRFPAMPVFILSGQHPPDLPMCPWDAWFLKGAPITELIRKLNTVLPFTRSADQKGKSLRGLAGETTHDGTVSVS